MKNNDCVRQLSKYEKKLYVHLLGIISNLYNSLERETIVSTLDELIKSLLDRCYK